MTIKKKLMVSVSVLFSFLTADAVHAFSWAPINPDELKMTSEPKAPGAAAIILEKQIDRDDADDKMSVYVRVKVLTEEGRKYGNVEIQYDKNAETVSSIEARTIRPDGKIINFDGKIFDRVIVKAREVRYQAKTFSLPEVEVGSIVEYHYINRWSWYVYDSQWILREELFVKHGKYSLVPYPYLAIQWSWPRGLPDGTTKPEEKTGRIQLETHDVPAFIVEDYMPPANELKYRVDFVYHSRTNYKDIPAKYWHAIGKSLYEDAKRFMDERSAMKKIVDQVVLPTDSNEQKLRKLYTHVQQLRNLSYERRKTEQENKRDRVKDINNVADVEKYGYGNATQLTYLYIALARAAGFSADIVFVSSRDRFFFQPELMNSNHLSSNVAVITVDGKEIYVEPGVPYVPFGLVPWYESGVSGIRISKEGGTWVKVPLTKATDAKTLRKASFKLEDGTLTGTVTVTYVGLEAIYHRLEERYDDDVARKEYMRDELKRAIPSGSDVMVTGTPDWDGVETPLVVEYKVQIPGWAALAGKRVLMPIGLFGNEEKHTFEQEKRIHPIYFHYSHIVDDDITIELPSGLHVNSSPKPRDENIALTTFSSSVETTGNAVRIKRNLEVNGIILAEKYYLALRDFYQTVRTYDEEQIMLVSAPLTSNTNITK